ncbi:hypothetical protein FQZ97_897140 [compost metagenome]
MYRQRAFRRVLAAVEREVVRPALALGIDIDTADLVGESIDQPADLRGIVAEQAQLLAEVRVQHIVDHLLHLAVRHDRNQRAELLFMVQAHLRRHRAE